MNRYLWLTVPIALVLTAWLCSTLGYASELTASEHLRPAPPGWPAMKIIYVPTSDRRIGEVCQAPRALACARANVITAVCVIYVSPAAYQVPGWDWHEKAHCAGREHY